MANTIAELLQLVTDKVLTGGRRTTAVNLKDVYNPLINSTLNIKDGGLVVETETGYTTEITLTDNKAFTHKKYVDDLVGSIGGGLNYLGVWNANTNIPALASSVGNSGDYYIVDVSGSTTLDGISDWNIGDWVIFSTVWQKIDNSEELQDLQSVLTEGNISTLSIETTGFIKTGGTSSEFLKADGSVDNSIYKLAIEDSIVGENVVLGDLLYLKDDGKYWKADYLDEERVSTELRMANETILANATGKVVVSGVVSGLSGLVVGEVYYVGANGNILKLIDIPDTEGIFVRIIGTAKSTTSLEFNPDETYIETTQIPISGGTTISLTTTGTSGASTLIANTLNIPQYSGTTDLSYTASPTNGIVVSSTGTDATIPLATNTDAGLLDPTDKVRLANTSGTNTDDETQTTIETKLGFASVTASTIAFFNATRNLISATGSNLGTFFQTFNSKSLPSNDDTIIVNDSSVSFEAKKTTLTQFKAFLKTYFDTLYAGTSGLTTNKHIKFNGTNFVNSLVSDNGTETTYVDGSPSFSILSVRNQTLQDKIQIYTTPSVNEITFRGDTTGATSSQIRMIRTGGGMTITPTEIISSEATFAVGRGVNGDIQFISNTSIDFRVNNVPRIIQFFNAQNTAIFVNGIKIGNNTDTAVTAGAGSIKYNLKRLSFSDGTNWGDIENDRNIVSPIATYTILSTEHILLNNQASTWTLPDSNATGIIGKKYLIYINNNTLTLDRTNVSDTINGAVASLSITAGYKAIEIRCLALNVWLTNMV